MKMRLVWMGVLVLLAGGWLVSCTLDFSKFTVQKEGGITPEPLCGNGRKDEGEQCDTGVGDCPTTCEADPSKCEAGQLVEAGTCQARCVISAIVELRDGDQCCPQDATPEDDSDCIEGCGDEELGPGETCDPSAEDAPCPESCEPVEGDDACTVREPAGTNCQVVCAERTIRAAIDGDGCCPEGADPTTDNDCDVECGDKVVEVFETCDPPSTCEVSGCVSDDPCRPAEVRGSAEECTLECVRPPIMECISGDGCCPGIQCEGMDDECVVPEPCGNGELDDGETCDDTSTTACPASAVDCDSPPVCRRAVVRGSARQCTAECITERIVACVDGDDCCPSTCNANNDNDCDPECPNGVVEQGEICDGDCPTSCDDSNECTNDELRGSPDDCDVVCVNTPIAVGVAATVDGGILCLPDGGVAGP